MIDVQMIHRKQNSFSNKSVARLTIELPTQLASDLHSPTWEKEKKSKC